MVVKSRYYPYPVLAPGLPNYIDSSSFSCVVLASSNRKSVRVEMRPKICDEGLTALVEAGKAEVIAHIECPPTGYRRVVPLLPNDLTVEIIEAGLLDLSLDVSTFIVAKEQIDSFNSPTFHKDYEGLSFSIAKGGLLAVCQTVHNTINLVDERLGATPSAIVIAPDADRGAKGMRVVTDEDQITIYLPEEQFKDYKALDDSSSIGGSGPRFHDVLLSMVVVPALTQVLSMVQREPLDEAGRRRLDGISDERWFGVVNKRVGELYESAMGGGDLFTVNFDVHPPLEIAQKIAGDPMVFGFKKLTDKLTEDE